MYNLQHPKHFLFSKVRQVGTNQLLYFTCVEPEARLLGRMTRQAERMGAQVTGMSGSLWKVLTWA